MVHQDIENLDGSVFERKAARGIILKASKILLLYTKLYNDYSLPGGGVDPNEDLTTGLKRELTEETGARNIEIVSKFGMIDEYRPHHKPGYDLIRILNYFYVCNIDEQRNEPDFEDYEIANGMTPIWVDINDAIKHNENVMANKESSMGMSIHRETFILQLIASELL